MSMKECEQVEAFVRAGGTVIGDAATATMDAHGKRLEKGQLDALFAHAPGKGRAVRLDLDLAEYGKERLAPPGGKKARDAVRAHLGAAGVEAPVKVLREKESEPLPGTAVVRWRGT